MRPAANTLIISVRGPRLSRALKGAYSVQKWLIFICIRRALNLFRGGSSEPCTGFACTGFPPDARQQRKGGDGEPVDTVANQAHVRDSAETMRREVMHDYKMQVYANDPDRQLHDEMTKVRRAPADYQVDSGKDEIEIHTSGNEVFAMKAWDRENL